MQSINVETTAPTTIVNISRQQQDRRRHRQLPPAQLNVDSEEDERWNMATAWCGTWEHPCPTAGSSVARGGCECNTFGYGKCLCHESRYIVMCRHSPIRTCPSFFFLLWRRNSAHTGTLLKHREQSRSTILRFLLFSQGRHGGGRRGQCVRLLYLLSFLLSSFILVILILFRLSLFQWNITTGGQNGTDQRERRWQRGTGRGAGRHDR